MENISQVNLQDLKIMTAQGVRQNRAGNLQAMQAQGNPFFMIIQNMLAQANAEQAQGTEGKTADFLQAFTDMLQDSPEKSSLLTDLLNTQNSGKDDEQSLNAETLTLAGMNNADILAVFNSLNNLPIAENTETANTSSVSNIQNIVNTAENLASQTAAAEEPQTPAISYRDKADEGKIQAKDQDKIGESDIVSINTLTSKANTAEKHEVVAVQRQFFNAVSTAKKNMTQIERPQNDEETENVAEEIAAQTSTPQPTVVSAESVKTDTINAAPEILDQLTTGISENLNVGKTEFVMKLQPEALGEITVKLVEEGGKKTLQIITGSTHTANLINSELAALRETMKPMQVEVHDVIFKTPEATNQTQLNLNLSGQQFGGHQFAGDQHRQFSSHAQNRHHYTEEYPENFAEEAQRLAQDGLNIYI